MQIKIQLAKKGQSRDCLSCVKQSELWEAYFKSNVTAVDDIEKMISKKQIYVALNAKPVINQLNDGNYEVLVKFSKKFCPIGGSHNPSRASIFHDNICIPYMRGFLNELFPQFIFGEDIINCVPLNNQRTCHYILKIEKKKV